MTVYRLALLLGLVSCVESANDIDLADEDVILEATGGAADGASWEPAETLHGNAKLYDHAGANARRVHAMWIAGTAASPVPMTVTARAAEGYDVRISVLGPIANGTRPTLGADGYSAAKRTAKVVFNATKKGEYLVVVGSYKLARDTSYTIASSCTSCAASVDALRTPKEFALVGDANRVVQIQLGAALANHAKPLQVEAWANAPMLPWTATKVATGAVAGNAVSITLPTTVKAGDDLSLVVREKDGRVLDTGVLARNIRGTQTSFARTDAVLFDDLVGMQVAGVVGFFEGQVTMRLRSETKKRDMNDVIVKATRPGQVGNGLNAFDAHFVPDFSVGARDGEILSVGFINGNGAYSRLGCFEYCNDLAGTGSCTGGTRTCP